MSGKPSFDHVKYYRTVAIKKVGSYFTKYNRFVKKYVSRKIVSFLFFLQEPCSWQCEHLRCTKQCFEICDREPCDKPCPKIIKCGHLCTGFCGELCPSICRICDEKDLPTFVREENKLSAR